MFYFQVFSKIISFNDGEIAYEYNDESKPLGKGSYGVVFKGKNNWLERKNLKDWMALHILILLVHSLDCT